MLRQRSAEPNGARPHELLGLGIIGVLRNGQTADRVFLGDRRTSQRSLPGQCQSSHREESDGEPTHGVAPHRQTREGNQSQPEPAHADTTQGNAADGQDHPARDVSNRYPTSGDSPPHASIDDLRGAHVDERKPEK